MGQVPFASDEGRRLFREAFLAGTMENYFHLAEQFRTQDEPTFCGLTTLAMALNSLRIDPMRTWKGAWRWFTEHNLGCCTGPDEVREVGLSFDMFRCLAACNGADIVPHRAPAAPEELADFEEAFRAAVRAIGRSRERECIVVCYSRELLGQTGAGHYSPVGGYHEGSDSILIMDVARFKYPPHWARLKDVVAAMADVDKDTGKPRGFMHLRLASRQGVEDDRGIPLPLHLSVMPAAAGKRACKALLDALAADRARASDCQQEGCESTPPPGVEVVRRWLSAVEAAEPQVLGQLLQVGDVPALREVLARLDAFPPFRELCAAYAFLAEGKGGGLPAKFPPIMFSGRPTALYGGDPEPNISTVKGGEIGLSACGELWVLLLLLLPEHLRSAVAEDLAGPWVAKGIAKAVRGPWALPLEALREALGHTLLPPPQQKRCSVDGASHAPVQ